jgi:type II secretory pathway pseudopilin PulG
MLEKLRVRLHTDERGFSLLETIIAVTLMFGLLLSIGAVATNGFRYEAYARERQGANQVANQVMETIRGLGYNQVIKGMTSSAQASDPNLVTSCAGDSVGTYRFVDCSGETVIATQASSPNVVPLVPNNGTCPGSVLSGCSSITLPATYSWRTYVTNNNTSTNPYRVTVLVSWTSKATSAGTKTLKLQSLFWSPTGCNGTTTSRPFGGPCKAFFYGQAIYPQGSVVIDKGSGSGILSNNFSTGTLFSPRAESDLQQEEIYQVQGVILGTEYSVTDTSTHTGGATTGQSTAADGDPASSASTYQTTNLTPAGGSYTSGTCSSGNNCITFTNPTTDSGTSSSATSAAGANVCPPSPATAENDSLPCNGTKTLQGSTMSALANIQSTNPVVGTTNIMQLAAPGSTTTTLADRDTGGTDGVVQDTVSRNIGQLDFGTIPSWISTNCTSGSGYPAGFTSFVQLANYSDSVQATAGTSSSAPTASISSGTLKYWSGSNGSATQTTITMSNSGSSGYGYSIPSNWTSTIGCTTGSGGSSNTVNATMSLSTGTIAMASQPACSSGGSTVTCGTGGTATRTDAQASIGSPIYGVFHYVVQSKHGIGASFTTALDVTMTVDLGTISGRSTYSAAPST